MTAPAAVRVVDLRDLLTPAHTVILVHSLGLARARESYRNYFCASDDHDDMPLISDLCGAGLMRLARRINGDRDGIYVVTDAGRAFIANATPTTPADQETQ